jgi:hypothetical protein
MPASLDGETDRTREVRIEVQQNSHHIAMNAYHSQPQPCLTRHRMTVGLPLPVPFNGSGCPVHVRRISCSFSSSGEVLFSFPLRYLFAIGYCAFIFSLGWPAPPLFC